MESMQILYLLLGSLVAQIPVILVLIIGTVFSFLRWSKHPKIAKLALGGLGILVFSTLLGIGFGWLRVQMPFLLGGDYKLVSYINIGLSFVENLVWAFGLALLIYSAWVGRDKNHESFAK
jgi:hypothetical protein